MAITPTGAPSWVRNSDHTTYGGHANKINYQGQGKVNARTDVGAEEFTRLAADLAALMRVGEFCNVTFTARDAGVLDPLVTKVTMQPSGVVTVSYAGGSPPTGFPSVTRVADGNYLITFAASYLDAYGVSGAWQPVHAMGGVHGSLGRDVGTTVGVSAVQVYVTSGGVAAPDETVSVSIW